MGIWKSVKAKRLFKALEKIGWRTVRRSGSHRTMSKSGHPDLLFSIHESEEVGPPMVAKIAKQSGLKPEDL